MFSLFTLLKRWFESKSFGEDHTVPAGVLVNVSSMG